MRDLSEAEAAVLNKLAEAYYLYSALPTSPVIDDSRDFRQVINTAQKFVFARPGIERGHSEGPIGIAAPVEIMVTVESGVAIAHDVPPGVQVRIKDYDCQGAADVKQDEDGENYQETIYGG